MRELIMWNLMTLDGYFDGPQAWDLEFHQYAWGEELKRFSLEQGREVGTKGDAAETVERLKQQPGKDIFVFGSADLSATLMDHGLFDEYRIGLVPVTPGEGRPLFKRDSEPLRLELVQSRPLGDRCLLLRYRPDGA